MAFAHKGTAEGSRHSLDLVDHPCNAVGDEETLNERANDGRAGRHKHRISIEPGKDRSLGQQWMTGAYAEHLFRIEMLEGKTRHFFRRRKPPHDKIEIADAQLFQQHRVLAIDDLDRRAGALGEEEFHRPRHEAERHTRRFNAVQLGGMAQAAMHEQERSGAAWTLEWLILPQMVVATGASLRLACDLMASLRQLGMALDEIQ